MCIYIYIYILVVYLFIYVCIYYSEASAPASARRQGWRQRRGEVMIMISFSRISHMTVSTRLAEAGKLQAASPR